MPQAGATSRRPLPPQARPASIPLPPPGLSEPEPPKQLLFNPFLSEQRTDTFRRPTRRGRAKSKAETRELCEQRREREISPSSLRSRGLNLHNQLDVSCICEIPEQTMNHPKIEAVDFGSNCRLGVCCMRLTGFWFYVYLSLVFRVYYHW